MFLADPPATQADLHFRLFGFPIRVHPFFWVLTIFLGMGGGKADPKGVLVWVFVVFISILVHELGHAFAIRLYGGYARIVLYSFGGMAIEDNARARRTPKQQIIISFAGPAAGFLLAGFVILLLLASGHGVGFAFSKAGITPGHFYLSFFGTYLHFESLSTRLLSVFVFQMLSVNIFWGLLNLLPIYPLDGGQISREVFLITNGQQGIIHSLWLSVFAAAAVAVYMFVTYHSFFMAFFFGYLAFTSWQVLEAYQGRGRPRW